MSFVGNAFRHDLYVSYRRGEVERNGPGLLEEWSEEFIRALQRELELRVELSVPGVSWLDFTRSIDRTKAVSETLQHELASTAIFVVLMTPGYLVSQWCQNELAWWISGQEARGLHHKRRIVVVDVCPTRREEWPERLIDEWANRLAPHYFYDRRSTDPTTGPLGWPWARDDREFWDALKKLGDDLVKLLMATRVEFQEAEEVVELITRAFAHPLANIAKTAPPPFRYHVFISYTRRDNDFPAVADIVATFTSALARLGIELAPYFYDEKDIGRWKGAPDQLMPQLKSAIDSSCSMIGVITPNYAKSDWCCWEWNYMKNLPRSVLDGRVTPAYWTRLNQADAIVLHEKIGLTMQIEDQAHLDEGWPRFKAFVQRRGTEIARELQARERSRKAPQIGGARPSSYVDTEKHFLDIIDNLDPQEGHYARQLVSEIHRISSFIREGYEIAASSNHQTIFINANIVDRDIVDYIIKEHLARFRLAWRVPLWWYDEKASCEELDEDLRQNLIDADGIMVVYGQAPVAWVIGQLAQIKKNLSRRSTMPRFVVVVDAPPPKPPLPIGSGVMTITLEKISEIVDSPWGER
jgi:hypothetical protein